jgi:hypothetical protein
MLYYIVIYCDGAKMSFLTIAKMRCVVVKRFAKIIL